jgi:dUTP pyrophosphatase
MELDPSELQVQLVHPAAQVPVRSRTGDAGLDLRTREAFALAPGERRKVPTGIAIALPPTMAGLVVPRSGLAAHEGVMPVLGLVDPNFRGELSATLLNTSEEAFSAEVGDRIAQLLLIPYWAPSLRVVEALPPSPDDRGISGWGSSGRR